MTLILIFNFLIYTAVSTINLTNKSLVLVSSIVGLLLFLVVDIPVVVVNFPVVKKLVHAFIHGLPLVCE